MTDDPAAKLDHDGAFCAHPTKAGLPCQRGRGIFGVCPRHTQIAKAVRSLPSAETIARAMADSFAEATAALPEPPGPEDDNAE